MVDQTADMDVSMFRQWRIDRGMTQADVARSLGISIVHVCCLEIGPRKPSRKLSNAIAAMTDGAVSQESWDEVA